MTIGRTNVGNGKRIGRKDGRRQRYERRREMKLEDEGLRKKFFSVEFQRTSLISSIINICLM